MKPLVRNVMIAAGVTVVGVGGYYAAKRYSAKRAALRQQLIDALKETAETKAAAVTAPAEPVRKPVEVQVGFTREKEKPVKLVPSTDVVATLQEEITIAISGISESLREQQHNLTHDLIEEHRQQLDQLQQRIRDNSQINDFTRRTLLRRIDSSWQHLDDASAYTQFVEQHDQMLAYNRAIPFSADWQDEWYLDLLKDVSHRQYGLGFRAAVCPKTQARIIVHLSIDGNVALFERSGSFPGTVDLFYSSTQGLDGLLGDSALLRADNIQAFLDESYLDRLAN